MDNVVSTGGNLRKVGKVIILCCLCICLSWIFVGWAILDGGYYLTSKLNTDPPRWKPLANDIAGKWKLSDESINFALEWETSIPAHEIEFHADGTFKATNFPKIRGWSDEKPILVFYTGSGRWYFDKMRLKPWALQLYYDDYNKDFLLPDYYFLQGKEAPYKIDDAPFMFEKE